MAANPICDMALLAWSRKLALGGLGSARLGLPSRLPAHFLCRPIGLDSSASRSQQQHGTAPHRIAPHRIVPCYCCSDKLSASTATGEGVLCGRARQALSAYSSTSCARDMPGRNTNRERVSSERIIKTFKGPHCERRSLRHQSPLRLQCERL